MDNNAFKALEEGDHPNITIKLKRASLSGNKWKVTGDLQISGSTRTENFDVITKMEGNKVVLSANTAFKLTVFGVDPPTAVFGTIKTGDEVTLNIEMNLNPIN
jgi:polyisoprenoid-binding protein YceI